MNIFKIEPSTYAFYDSWKFSVVCAALKENVSIWTLKIRFSILGKEEGGESTKVKNMSHVLKWLHKVSGSHKIVFSKYF